jgi:putative acetyltransferase
VAKHSIVIRITQGDVADPRVLALIETHVSLARGSTAPDSAHALDITGLQSPDVELYTLWDDDVPVAIGALKHLSPDHGEVKSMFADPSARRRGTGSAMLAHIIATAKERGMSRLSLETGSWEYFAPARAFYQRHGFRECEPFAQYVPDPNSVFMTLSLHEPSE